MIKFEEGYKQKDFIFFRNPTTGPNFLKDNKPFYELAIVEIAKGGVYNDTMSWDGNWNFKIIKRFFGDGSYDRFI